MSTERFDMTEAQLQELGQRTLSLMIRAMGDERKAPITPSITGQRTRDLVDEPPPRTGISPSSALDLCERVILPGSRRNGHPGFFAYVSSSIDPVGVLADALVSALNQNLPAWRSAPIPVQFERTVVAWLAHSVGFASPHGSLTSGGSMANLTGLATALRTAEIAHGCTRERLVVYLTSQTHFSLQKAAMILGVTEAQRVQIPIDGDRRMIPRALRERIIRDRSAGLVPACVCLSAGTTNTGAIDPICEIAQTMPGEPVWVHVDGAYGAPAAMTNSHAHLREAFARVDSLSLDPHKWLFAPLDCGCLLVRDDARSVEAMRVHADYTAVSNTEDDERFAYFDRTLETSRRFRALKVWMILKVRGLDAIAREIERNIALRVYLDRRIDAENELEPLGSGLSVACFRYVPAQGASPEDLNALNRRILDEICASGDLFMSPTILEGRFALRVCIVNHRTSEADVDRLIDAVVRAGRHLS